MKKVTIILMALALLLLAMPVMADPSSGEPPVSKDITVNITVAQYAAIYADDFTINIPDTNEVDWDIEFDVLANFPHTVSVDDSGAVAALKAWEMSRDSGEETPGVKTTFKYGGKAGAFAGGEMLLADDDGMHNFSLTIEVTEGAPNG